MMKYHNLAIAILSILLITACSNDSKTNPSSDEEETTVIRKYESVELPVQIYRDENYEPGHEATFIRTIESIEVTKFTEGSAIDFFDRYDRQTQDMNLDLVNDYKQVIISMSHALESETVSDHHEAFILDRNSQILFNNEPLLNEVVNYQLQQATLERRMGRNYETEGDVILAIPNELFEGILQLKTVSRNNSDNEVIYLDLK
ncbi:hypothetical protein [Alkalihalobacillus sp. LMS39]|uniref:hypothetical protein n=1 Tax=Alkalihalobacillus sp. LMS39 TaxID=2924032 RepID=UPI001FB25AE5|nr:hypothetical protein [Alkalihalobacillus sp. LMS39]UOE94773.1 hypothetical protein MM271_03760 [Alkalihalobacillus sp. LMS39]